MKKRTIWTIAIIMGTSFLALLFVQLKYIQEMADMKKEQFDESVNRALYQASRNMELNETLRYLEKDINETEHRALQNDSASGRNGLPDGSYQRSHQLSLGDKGGMNFKSLDQDLKNELMSNGINLQYHFTVSTPDGREIYRCSDYSEEGEDYSYSQVLFRNDPASKMGLVKIHFPDMNSYIYSSVRFVIPSVIFTLVLLVTFIFTIVVIFRQKRYTEMRNDFINNMTHELKTPISSISLAAQMLNDTSVTKSESMMKHLGGVINDESKRLRFLVEKVLQMSLFDKKKAIFNMKQLDLNEMAENIAHTFTLRVEHTGGKIYTEIEAIDSTIYVDEMHFQNAIFNLMDNAVKYKKPDGPLDIYLRTWNDDDHLYLSVRDTGIGIKKDNLKKVFEKFFRVHTGNLHNVKGFGLGLAYVKKIIDVHKGEISVESEYGKGTTFTIKLPIIKD